MRKILTTLFCISSIFACSSSYDPQPENPSILRFKDARGSTTSGGNLIDHGGKILPVNNTYSIFWGNQNAFPSDAKSGLDSLFNGLNGSSFLNISSQYMRGATSSTTFHTNWIDLSSPPTHSPSVSTIGNEVCTIIGQNNATPDTNGIYFVYTSNFPHLNFCAFHSWSICNGVDIQIAYLPNVSGVAGCNPGDLYGCNTYSEGTRALANVSSHEFMEAVTDPEISSWYNASGSEIGDICAWQFSSCVQLSTGSFQLQKEWDNQTSSCIQQ